MPFDVHIAVMLAAIVTLIVAAGLRVSLRGYAPALRDTSMLWVFGVALQPLAWVLIDLRGAIPDLFSVVLANVLLCMAYAEWLRAARRFSETDADDRAPHMLVALGLAANVLWLYVWPSESMRTVVMSALLGCLAATAGRLLLAHAPQPRPTSYAITAIAFFIGAALMMARAAYEALNPLALETAPIQVVAFGYSVLLPIIATIGFVLMCHDRSLAESRHTAGIDALTGVFNRHTLEQLANERMGSARDSDHPFVALLIDADHLERINDNFGHETGDAALRAMVLAIRDQLSPDDLIGRLGGGEFLIALGRDEVEARLLAERQCAAVETLDFVARGQRIPLSVSIGVATLGEESELGALVRRAGAAMRHAKRSGRNRVATLPLDSAANAA